MTTETITLFIIGFIIVLLFLPSLLTCARAWSSGAAIPLMTLMMMRFRGTPYKLLIDAAITLNHSKEPASYEELERTYMAEKYAINSPEDLIETIKNKRNDQRTNSST